MPHCSTKYSPYYLVYGRDRRLPIEDDWKPNLGNKNLGDDEYEGHVTVLAQRLRDANKTAGQQSKLSHDTAKRYYDRQTKLEQFSTGDFVYIHDSTYKRGKAKKFSYQYRGPFEIEQKISSLIYKVRLTDGTFTIIHVNRLKRAHKQIQTSEASLIKLRFNETMTDQLKGHDSENCEELIKTEEVDIEAPSHSQILAVGSENSSVSEEEIDSSPRGLGEDFEWTPGSSYLRRKLRSDNATDGVAYRLRSRLVSRSEQETEGNKTRVETVGSPGSEHAQGNTSPSKVKTASSHIYI
jgi:hypothetical protein